MDLLCYGLQQKLLRNLIFLGIIVLQLIFVPAVFTSRKAVRLLWNVTKNIIWHWKVWLFFTDSFIIIRATLRAFGWWKQKPSRSLLEIHIWHCFYSCIRKDGADISLTKPFAPRFFFGTCVKVPTQIVERSLYFWYLLFSSNGMASIQ